MINHKIQQACFKTKPCNRSRRHAQKHWKNGGMRPHISELRKLTILRSRFSAHAKNKNMRKGGVILKPALIYHILVYITTFWLIVTAPWQSLFDHGGTRKLPGLMGRRTWRWKLDVHSRMRNKVVFFPSPDFPSIIKLQPTKFSVWHLLARPLVSLTSILF